MSAFPRDDNAELKLKKELLEIVREKKKDVDADNDAIIGVIIDLEDDIKRLEKDLNLNQNLANKKGGD